MTAQPRRLLWVGSEQNFDRPPRGFLVAAPVTVRRVIVEASPAIEDSDPFARAVVNLATAGVHRITEIGELIGIKDDAFLSEVVRRLESRRLVRERNGSVEVLVDSGSGGDARTVAAKRVWYLVQDEYSGKLWPRVATRVRNPESGDERDRTVELGTPGNPATRRFWRMPEGEAVPEPDSATVRQAIDQHLRDMRTVGLRHNREGSEHLATLGTPEKRQAFSARLGPGVERTQLLVMLDAPARAVTAADPFGVGPWFEFAHWVELLLQRSPPLRDRVIHWAERQRNRPDTRHPAAADDDPSADHARPGPEPDDRTKSRLRPAPPTLDWSGFLLLLADRLRAEIARCGQKTPCLTYDSVRDQATAVRRWETLGFAIPSRSPKLVPALVERAAEGSPADPHVLFYAWTLMVDVNDGRALAALVPNLPSLLSDNARGSTPRAIPDLRSSTAALHQHLTESR